jgi:hypothetical protein
MKLVSQIVFVLIITFACGGGGSKEEEKTDTTQTKEKTEEITENSSEEEKNCYYSPSGAFVSLNLIIKGGAVSGSTQRGSTPGRISEYANIKEGTKNGNKLTLTFITVDTETGQGIGETYREVWLMKGDGLVPEAEGDEASVYAVPLEKTKCEESAKFNYEASKAEAPQSYELDGVMNKKIKIKMFLTAKPDAEDKSITLYEGYYYYLNQGKDKKIALKGARSMRSPAPLELNEVVGEKTFGKFMIEGFEFSEEFTCTWVSADGKKEMQTVFKPTK